RAGPHVERPQLFEHGGVVAGGRPLAADNPGVKLGIGRFHQPLEIVEACGVERGDMGVGEAADDQVHLAHAAAPGPEQNLAPPLVQSLARPFGHRCAPTPKARTRPGEAYIESEQEDVSGSGGSLRTGAEPRARNPYPRALRLWIPGSRPLPRPGMTK